MELTTDYAPIENPPTNQHKKVKRKRKKVAEDRHVKEKSNRAAMRQLKIT
jgi:hypothetical protein